MAAARCTLGAGRASAVPGRAVCSAHHRGGRDRSGWPRLPEEPLYRGPHSLSTLVPSQIIHVIELLLAEPRGAPSVGPNPDPRLQVGAGGPEGPAPGLWGLELLIGRWGPRRVPLPPGLEPPSPRGRSCGRVRSAQGSLSQDAGNELLVGAGDVSSFN